MIFLQPVTQRVRRDSKVPCVKKERESKQQPSELLSQPSPGLPHSLRHTLMGCTSLYYGETFCLHEASKKKAAASLCKN